MRLKRLPSGQYEASGSHREINVELLVGNIPVEFVGFGETGSEAINRCLNKIDQFFHPDIPDVEEELEVEEFSTESLIANITQ